MDSTDALSRYIYTSVRSPLLRMRGATRIGIESDLSPAHLGLQTRGGGGGGGALSRHLQGS